MDDFISLLCYYLPAKEHNGACPVLISGKHMRFYLKGSLSIFEYSYREACILSFGGFKETNAQVHQDRQDSAQQSDYLISSSSHSAPDLDFTFFQSVLDLSWFYLQYLF